MASRGGNNKNGPASFYLSSFPSTITDLLKLQKNITSSEHLSYVVELQNQTLPYSIYFPPHVLPSSPSSTFCRISFLGEKTKLKRNWIASHNPSIYTIEQEPNFLPGPCAARQSSKRDDCERASEHASKTRATENQTKCAATLFRFECRCQDFIGPTIIHCHPII